MRTHSQCCRPSICAAWVRCIDPQRPWTHTNGFRPEPRQRMKRLVETRNEAGGILLVEVEEQGAEAVTPAPTGRVTRGLQPGQVREKTQATFEDGMRAVMP